MSKEINPKMSEFQVRNIRLIEIAFKRNDKTVEAKEFQLKPKIVATVKRFNEKRIAIVVLNVSLFEDIEDAPFAANVSYEGEFIWDETVSEERLQTLLDVNAPAVLYSYMRPVFTDFTTKACFPPLILPMANFTKQNIENKTTIKP